MDQATNPRPSPRRQLNLFDVTNLVVGSIIGADIYIVAGPGAQLLGPAILVAWLVAAVLTAAVALCFARCALLAPEVGGAYAYVRRAFGTFPAFMAGWVLYLTQWAALAVFPVAFVSYLDYLLPGMDGWRASAVKVLFMGFVLISNIVGVRIGGRLNDVLTLAKLAPLFLFVSVGLGYLLLRQNAPGHLAPFAPFGWGGLGPALVLVYFAFTGVELVGLPAAEIVRPRETLPKAILLGVLIVTACYLLVTLVTVSTVPAAALAQSATPLAFVAEVLANRLGLANTLAGLVMAGGALLSIAGAAVAITLCTARLTYAMALDGLFPSFFARLHPRFATPHHGLLFLTCSALVAALVSDLLPLITISVFSASLVYIATSLAVWRLASRGAKIVPLAGVVASLVLLLAAAPQAGLTGLALVLAGIAAYPVIARHRQC